MYKTDVSWDSGVKRMDHILYNKSEHKKKLDKDLNFGHNVDSTTRDTVTDIIETCN